VPFASLWVNCATDAKSGLYSQAYHQKKPQTSNLKPETIRYLCRPGILNPSGIFYHVFQNVF
jgi:hypothetical protein